MHGWASASKKRLQKRPQTISRIMKVIGISGGIGSGKSTFCGFLSELGAPVFICDDQARKLYVEDREFALWVTREILGDLPGDGRTTIPPIDLRAVSNAVFKDKTLLRKLEAQVFGRLIIRLDAWLSSQAGPAAFIESAIFDKAPEFASRCDIMIEIVAEDALARAASRDGAEISSIEARAAAQGRVHADTIIYNDGTLGDLKAQAAALYNRYSH